MKHLASLVLSRPLTAVGVVVPSTILGALAIEAAGYPPCTLCLYQRVPYYLLCALFLLMAPLRKTVYARRYYRTFAVVVLTVLVASGGLGVFHAGVEFSLWKGPSGCAGGTIEATDMKTLLETLRNTKAVSCTKASFWVFGMSLAVWNAIISFALAVIVVFGLTRKKGI